MTDHRFDSYDGHSRSGSAAPPVRLLPTFTGRRVDPLNLDPDLIDPADIAHSLAKTDRWGGHGRIFYSVAEHSLRMARMVIPEYRLAALLHDASEAYWRDLPRPIKRSIPEYEWGEARCQAVIAAKYGLVFPWPESITFWDDQMIHAEGRWLGLAPDPSCQGSIDPDAQLKLDTDARVYRPGLAWPDAEFAYFHALKFQIQL